MASFVLSDSFNGAFLSVAPSSHKHTRSVTASVFWDVTHVQLHICCFNGQIKGTCLIFSSRVNCCKSSDAGWRIGAFAPEKAIVCVGLQALLSKSHWNVGFWPTFVLKSWLLWENNAVMSLTAFVSFPSDAIDLESGQSAGTWNEHQQLAKCVNSHRGRKPILVLSLS